MRYSVLILVLSSVFMLSSCAVNKDNEMFTDKIEKLINSVNEDDEEIALSELLQSVKNTEINYGYRVFNITKDKRVMPDKLNDELYDELLVTIFVGSEAP